MMSFEERVIEELTCSDEYVPQVMEVVERYYKGEITSAQLYKTLDDLHDSATIAISHRLIEAEPDSDDYAGWSEPIEKVGG